jgi:hypothetical protein
MEHSAGTSPQRDLPVGMVHIDDEDLLDLSLGQFIYSKEQVEDS